MGIAGAAPALAIREATASTVFHGYLSLFRKRNTSTARPSFASDDVSVMRSDYRLGTDSFAYLSISRRTSAAGLSSRRPT
jgi:hypothetical protein